MVIGPKGMIACVLVVAKMSKKTGYKWIVQATEDGSLVGIYNTKEQAEKRLLEVDPLEDRHASYYCGPYYEVLRIRLTDEGHVIYV
jgi:hypothetical protein